MEDDPVTRCTLAETRKLEAETRKLEAETRKLELEAESRNRWIPIGLAAIIGALIAYLLKY